MNLEVYPLFSAPIAYIEDTGYHFTDEEITYFKGLETRDNGCNFVTKDCYVLENPIVKNVKKFCEKQLHHYTRDILRIKQEFYITNSWTTHNKKGESHRLHRHFNCIFSGVFYINASPEMGRINFEHGERFSKDFFFQYDFEDYNVFNSGTWSFAPKTSSMILFPSWLKHSVDANETDETRMIVGFNSFVKGTFGGDGYVNDLELSQTYKINDASVPVRKLSTTP